MKFTPAQEAYYERITLENGGTLGKSSAEFLTALQEAGMKSFQMSQKRSKRPKAILDKEKQAAQRKSFQDLCVANGLPVPRWEYKFFEVRKWAFDWAFLGTRNCGQANVALEIEGGIFAGKTCPACKRKMGGRHNSGKGFLDDLEKYREALLLGWKVLRVTPQDIESGKVFEWLKRLL